VKINVPSVCEVNQVEEWLLLFCSALLPFRFPVPLFSGLSRNTLRGTNIVRQLKNFIIPTVKDLIHVKPDNIFIYHLIILNNILISSWSFEASNLNSSSKLFVMIKQLLFKWSKERTSTLSFSYCFPIPAVPIFMKISQVLVVIWWKSSIHEGDKFFGHFKKDFKTCMPFHLTCLTKINQLGVWTVRQVFCQYSLNKSLPFGTVLQEQILLHYYTN